MIDKVIWAKGLSMFHCTGLYTGTVHNNEMLKRLGKIVYIVYPVEYQRYLDIINIYTLY